MMFLVDSNVVIDFPTKWRTSLSELALYAPSHMAATEDGTICWVDQDTKQLVFLDSSGKMLSRVGRRGQGPGEFQAIDHVGWLSEEHLFWAFDPQNSRLSFWTPEGLVDDHHIQQNWDTNAGPRLLNRERGFYIADNKGCKDSVPRVGGFHVEDPKRDVFWSMEPLKKDVGLHLHKGRRNITGNFEWDPILVFEMGNGFLAINYTEEATITIFDIEQNRIAHSWTTDTVRRPTTKEDRMRIIEEEIPASMRADLGPLVRQPSYYPAVKKLMIDGSNHIWVFSNPGAHGGAIPFQVFDRAGKMMRKGQVPEVPRYIQKSDIYFLETNDDGDLFLIKAGITGFVANL
jgi:hypothetical protein